MSSQDSPPLSLQAQVAAPLAATVRAALQQGEAYAGLILGKNGAPDHHLVLLAGDIDDVTWSNARDWAARTGGELPTRRELSLLHANLKELFQRVWYWSAEQSEARSQLVWGQNFSSGIQTMYGRQFHGRACAVRRIPETGTVVARDANAVNNASNNLVDAGVAASARDGAADGGMDGVTTRPG